jgi:hypothetical protein
MAMAESRCGGALTILAILFAILAVSDILLSRSKADLT